MQKASWGLGQVKGFRNNYLAPILATALLLITFCATAQYDSTKNLQLQQAYGFDWRNGNFRSSLGVPLDTPKLALKDSGRIAYKGSKFWIYDGVNWIQTSSGTITMTGEGIDSATFNAFNLCYYYHTGEVICYPMDRFVVRIAENYDFTKLILYNGQDVAFDSVEITRTPIFPGENITITDTTGGIPVRQAYKISATTGSGSVETASNLLTKVGNDIQLGGIATKDDTLSLDGNHLVINNGHVSVNELEAPALGSDDIFQVNDSLGYPLMYANSQNHNAGLSVYVDGNTRSSIEAGPGQLALGSQSADASVQVEMSLSNISGEIFHRGGLTYLEGNNLTGASSYNILTTDYIVAMYGGTATLPLADRVATGAGGTVYIIKNKSAINTTTVATTSGQTIDGQASYSLPPLTSITVYEATESSTDSWEILSGYSNSVSPGSSPTPVYQEIISTGGQTTFSFTTVPTTSAGYMIYVNGAAIPKTYYSVSTNDIIFSAGLVNGDSVVIQGIE